MNTATFVKDVSDEFTGTAFLYRVDPPMKEESWFAEEDEELQSFDYVVVSATSAFMSGAETYIFGADENGEVLDWGELPGSYRGGLDHQQALEDAGYVVQ
jgi:hypothetical protein